MLTKQNKFFSFILICLFGGNMLAQYSKGLSLYNHLDYYKAIPKFKKATKKKNAHQQDAFIKLGDCYYFDKKYKEAEECYKQAEELGNIDASAHYHYGMVLKNNNHYDEALREFQMYLQANPNDGKAKNALKSCNEIKTWQTKPKEYDVVNFESVNTSKSEFAPVLYQNKLVFISEQLGDLVNYQEFDYNGTPYLNVYFTELKNGQGSKIKGFSKRVNSNYHDGPVCFSKDENTLYLTRINYVVNKKSKDFVNRAKIFVSTKNGNSWGKLQSFQYNSDDYSVAHPCLSPDGNSLYFSSDMPGGFGGKDLYVCKKNGTGWDKPKNLGADINTSGDETFPSIRSTDGMLFFSSDGLPGFGGLDIFSAKQIQEQWILNRNEGLGINSFTDDFGICFLDNKTGYMSSDRDGGKGSDDIYKFTFTNRYVSLDGYVLYSKDSADAVNNIKVWLADLSGVRLGETSTNKEGYFRFDNLEEGKKYNVIIDQSSAGYNNENRFYYASSKKELQRITTNLNTGDKFVFRNLPADPNSLPEIDSPDDVNIAGNILYGENPSSPLAYKKLVLLDEKGKVIETTTTNAFGAFVFNKLPPDKNYLIELSEDDANLPANSKIILTTSNGKEVKVLRAGSKGDFKFKILAGDKNKYEELVVEDADLVMNFKGKLIDKDSKVLPGTKVYLLNDKGEVVETAVTDANGKFEFKKLNSDKNYLISLGADDPTLAGYDRLFITDLSGKVKRELIRDKLKGFKYHLLKSDHTEMAELYVDDPWLEVLEMKNKKLKEALTIIEKVYYSLGDYKFDDNGRLVLDKVIGILKSDPNLKIELSSHTDSRAADAFNLTLSQKRAKTAVDYMVSKGIDKKRLIAIGYGETQLKNKCGNDVECTEEEHAENRRTEFKIIQINTK